MYLYILLFLCSRFIYILVKGNIDPGRGRGEYQNHTWHNTYADTVIPSSLFMSNRKAHMSRFSTWVWLCNQAWHLWILRQSFVRSQIILWPTKFIRKLHLVTPILVQSSNILFHIRARLVPIISFHLVEMKWHDAIISFDKPQKWQGTK
jgi:hypothetical protein